MQEIKNCCNVSYENKQLKRTQITRSKDGHHIYLIQNKLSVLMFGQMTAGMLLLNSLIQVYKIRPSKRIENLTSEIGVHRLANTS